MVNVGKYTIHGSNGHRYQRSWGWKMHFLSNMSTLGIYMNQILSIKTVLFCENLGSVKLKEHQEEWTNYLFVFGFAFCILWICANHAWLNVFRWTPTDTIYKDLQKHKWTLFLDAIQFMVVPENRGHSSGGKQFFKWWCCLLSNQNGMDDGVQVHHLTYRTYTWNILRHGLVACRVRSELVFLV